MKSNLKTVLLIAIAVIFIISCKKGDTGSAGPQGPKGDTGATGADGTKIFSGQGVPATALGRNGDFYVDLSTSNMYGPKTDAGWGTPQNLKGANGSAGSKIYSGTGAPNNSTGIAGDYFMSTDTYLFYGPKTSTGWGTPVNLKGPKGDKGDKGDPGENANIVSTDWIAINNWAGIPTVFNSGTYAPTTQILNLLRVTSLSEFISNSGVVLVYAKNNATKYIAMLPEVTERRKLEAVFPIDHNNEIIITIMATNNSIDIINDVNFVIANYTFRFVFIPGNQIVSSASGAQKQVKINNKIYTEQQLKTMSFDKVSKLLNL